MRTSRLGATGRRFYTPDAHPGDRLLNAVEVAKISGVPKGWVYDRARTNALPFRMVRIGKYLRFPQSGLKKFLKESSIQGMR